MPRLRRALLVALPALLPALPACRAPGPAVVSAAEVATLPPPATIQGRDGGESAVLFDRSVWIYGDTVLNVDDEDGHNWHHNSYSWTTDTDAADGIGPFEEAPDAVGAPRHLVAPTPDEAAFNDAHWGEDCANATAPVDDAPCGARWATWPGSATWDAARERAYVFYGLIYAEPGDFNFEGHGASVAVWDDFDAGPVRPLVDAAAEHPDLLWGPDDGGWGAAAVLDDEHLYAFSCDGQGLGDACTLARAPTESVQEPAAWRYWDGSGWSSEARDAHALFAGAPILSVTWNAHLDAWLAVYSPPFDATTYARTAPALTGPWSAAAPWYDAPDPDAPYDVVQHAEFAEDDGRVVYLGYTRATTGWFGREGVLVRVELE